MIELTSNSIDTNAVVDRVRHPEAGAVVLFLGTTRKLTADRQTIALDYEAYDEMAERKLAELEAEALVQPARRHERGHRTGLEAQALAAAGARLGDDVAQNCARDAPAEMGARRTHRLAGPQARLRAAHRQCRRQPFARQRPDARCDDSLAAGVVRSLAADRHRHPAGGVTPFAGRRHDAMAGQE